MEAYKTLIGRQYADRIQTIKRDIDAQEALSNAAILTPISAHIIAAGIENERMTTWLHPFFYKGNIYVDPRAYYGNQGTIRNKPEYQFLIKRAQIEYLWETQPESFETILSPIATIYGQWISSALAARFALPPTDGATIKILATAFIVGKFLWKTQREVSGDDIKQQTLRVLSSRGGWLPAETVNEVLSTDDVSHWLEHDQHNLNIMMRVLANNVTTEMGQLTENTLVQLMTVGSWIGDNNIALAGLALEHIPTLTLMVGTVEASTMHRNKTRIGRTVAGLSRNVNVKAVGSFIKGLDDADAAIGR